MSGILWDNLVFGPIKSRRLGSSLGVNLLPGNNKICTFNCVYCECGWGDSPKQLNLTFNKKQDIIVALENKLKELKSSEFILNSITFAGNGEPTIHPDFSEIVDDVIRLRNQYFPKTIITCLSNSTMIGNELIRNALLKLDNPWMKLDAGSQKMFQLINQSFDKILVKDVVENLQKMSGQISIQTLMLRGIIDGEKIDNTQGEELELWISHLEKIKPIRVILYPIDRETPLSQLEKISKDELEHIADRIRQKNMEVLVFS